MKALGGEPPQPAYISAYISPSPPASSPSPKPLEAGVRHGCRSSRPPCMSPIETITMLAVVRPQWPRCFERRCGWRASLPRSPTTLPSNRRLHRRSRHPGDRRRVSITRISQRLRHHRGTGAGHRAQVWRRPGSAAAAVDGTALKKHKKTLVNNISHALLSFTPPRTCRVM